MYRNIVDLLYKNKLISINGEIEIKNNLSSYPIITLKKKDYIIEIFVEEIEKYASLRMFYHEVVYCALTSPISSSERLFLTSEIKNKINYDERIKEYSKSARMKKEDIISHLIIDIIRLFDEMTMKD